MKKETSETRPKKYVEVLVKKFEEEEKRKKEGKEEKGKEKKEGFVKWLGELGKKELLSAGGKGANLAELFKIGMPVPQAFVVTAQAYEYFVSGLKKKIFSILRLINIENTFELEKASREIQKIIVETEMPSEMKEEIIEAYSAMSIDEEILKIATSDALAILKTAKEPCFVAVRSSATTEDLKTASFAGQQETFLNVKGNEKLLEAIKKCFASLFTARAIYYREKRGFLHEKSAIAVIVQRMVNSEKSGVVFTINPVSGENEILIEASFGLGEGVVSGAVMPDCYIVDKKNFVIKEKKIGKKNVYFTRTAAGETIKRSLQPEKVFAQTLSESEIKQLANFSLAIEEHFAFPQDIEWAIEDHKIYILQSRPVTTKGRKEKIEIRAFPILKGIPASPGVASGTVKIVRTFDDLKKIQHGDILVTKMTNPDMVVTMQKASAIVTEEGGYTAHAAIVSREMGIPCVTGTKIATSVLEENSVITVNGNNGEIYLGRHETTKAEILPVVKTKTKIKVIVDLPQAAERASLAKTDGIGLLRIEGIIASSGKHPLKFLKENNLEEYEEIIFQGIREIAKFFPDKEIWIRTSDIRSDEFSNLEGAPEIEKNPMLGMHGIRASLAKKEIFVAELKAIKRITITNRIGIMLPQVISVEEIRKAKQFMRELDIKAKIGSMIETPAAVEIIEEICKEVDFVSLGTNDLTQYTLAVDRGNEAVQYLYDEMHPSILRQISRVIRTCKKFNVESSICGQAASKPEMVRFLVKEGINSISVNVDAAYEISKLVAELEEEKIIEETIKEEIKEEREEGGIEKIAKEKIKKKESKDDKSFLKKLEESWRREYEEKSGEKDEAYEEEFFSFE